MHTTFQSSSKWYVWMCLLSLVLQRSSAFRDRLELQGLELSSCAGAPFDEATKSLLVDIGVSAWKDVDSSCLSASFVVLYKASIMRHLFVHLPSSLIATHSIDLTYAILFAV